jgi:hypothetical protein
VLGVVLDSAWDELQHSLPGPASRLLTDQCGSLAEGPAVEDWQHSRGSNWPLLLANRKGVADRPPGACVTGLAV